MGNKSIIIIGAGLAGLATGCFAQMNGYSTKIYELQNKPGGVCVSWKRNGYTFDYAVHNVFGLAPNSVNNKLWRELGALRNLKTFRFEEFVRVEDSTGKSFTVYTDLNKLEQHMKELSPSDSKLIEEYVKAVTQFSGYDLFEGLTGGALTKLKMLPLMRSLIKYSKTSLKEYADRFTDPFLRKAFATIQYDIAEVPTLITLIFLSTLNNGDGGWPIGGSAVFSKNIEKRYLELGGQVEYSAKVKKILTKDDKAVGIRLEDDSENFADIVVSAADGYSTIFGMLDGKYVNEMIGEYYGAVPKTQVFGLETWFGVNRDFSNEPHALVLFLDKPISIENRELDKLDLEIFNFDPTFAPSGKCVIKVVMESNYDYWKNLASDPENYRLEKQKVAETFARKLEHRFPGIGNQIEATDVVTPITVESWTNSYRGYQAYPAPAKYQKEINKNGLSKTLPGLENFYMVGQWAGATIGLNTVSLMGRNLVKGICKKDGKKFVSSSWVDRTTTT
jgi:phytoene dehydrogenase-like protein